MAVLDRFYCIACSNLRKQAVLVNKDAIQIVLASTSCSAPLMVARNKIRFSGYKALFTIIFTTVRLCLFLFLSLVSTLSVLTVCPLAYMCVCLILMCVLSMYTVCPLAYMCVCLILHV